VTAVAAGRLLGGAPLGPRPPVDVLAAVEAAGVVGRGGGGFPTARKLASVRGRRRTLVGNAAEGEPLSAKDAALLARAPHLVAEGLALAAAAIGAERAVLAVKAGTPGAGLQVPDRYVASEESALANLAAGGPALPRTGRPADRGTLVLNAETLANVALAVHAGPAAYRAVGDPAEPGTRLLTVAGAVPAPGVVELPTGTPAGVALAAAGATPEGTAAVLTGGYGGTWLPGPAAWDLPLTNAAARAAGAALGPGILAVLPPHACGLAETARVTRWLAGQSAGQCGPCVFGLPDVAGALDAALAGNPAALAAVRRWTATLPGRGACRHPDGAARLVTSALTVFAADLAAHVAGRPCGGWSAPPVLPVPTARPARAVPTTLEGP
jgi:NADH:ubiquinone oxidoreductase subunit F (NADH-binding)